MLPHLLRRDLVDDDDRLEAVGPVMARLLLGMVVRVQGPTSCRRFTEIIQLQYSDEI